MKKKLCSILLFVLLISLLTGCCLSHKWVDATCTAPKTCEKCGKTEGEALGHTWVDPDCVTPKTCSVCGETEGEALGHTWVDADCVTPKTCSVCAETEGEALGHTWVDADCVTPKTCSVCEETEGEPLGHTWVDATCTAPKTCSACEETEGEALGHTWIDADCVTPKTCSVCGETEGEALGHTWVDADCVTPKTCSVCGETEGEALGHTWVDADCVTPKTCSACGETEGEALGHTWVDATCTAPKTCSVCAETEGNVADHVPGKWVIAKEATVLTEGTKEQKCANCGEILKTESYALESFHDDDHFLFTPNEFLKLLNKVLRTNTGGLMSTHTITGDDGEISSFILQGDSSPAMIVLTDKYDDIITSAAEDLPCVVEVDLAFIIDELDSVAQVEQIMSCVMLCCDPQLDMDAAETIAFYILENDPDYYTATTNNGLSYSMRNLSDNYAVLEIAIIASSGL